MKSTWAPRLEAALNPGGVDTASSQIEKELKPTRGGHGGFSRGALFGFVAGGICMAAFVMITRRSARL